MDWDSLLEPEGDDVVVRRFTASYTSTGECGCTIYEGEEAGYVGDDTKPTCGECLP
jgi:hypothetical protein